MTFFSVRVQKNLYRTQRLTELMSEDSEVPVSDPSQEDLGARIAKLEETMDSYKSLFKTLAASVQDFLSEGSFGARIAKIEFEFDTIKTSVEKHLKKVREISDHVEAEGKAIEKVATEVNTYYDIINNLNKEMPALQENMRENFDNHRTQIKKLIRQSKTQEAETQSLHEEISNLKTALEQRIQEFQNETAEKSKSDKAGMNDAIGKVKTELEQLLHEYQTANDDRIRKIEERHSNHSKKATKRMDSLQAEINSTNEGLGACNERLDELNALRTGIDSAKKLIGEHSKDLTSIHGILDEFKGKFDVIEGQTPQITANQKAIAETRDDLNALRTETQRAEKNINKAVAASDKKREEFQDGMTLAFGEVTSKMRVLMGEEKVTIPELVKMNETTRKLTKESIDEMRSLVETTRKDVAGKLVNVEKNQAAASEKIKAEFEELRSDLVGAVAKLNKKNKDGFAAADAKLISEVQTLKAMINEVTGGSSYSIQNLVTHFEGLDSERKTDLARIESGVNKALEIDSEINGHIEKVSQTSEKHIKKVLSQLNSLADDMNQKFSGVEEQRTEAVQYLKQKITTVTESIMAIKTECVKLIEDAERRCKQDSAAQTGAITASQTASLKKIDAAKAEITEEFASALQKINEKIKKLGSRVEEFQGDSGYSLPALASDIRNVSRKLRETKEETTQKIIEKETSLLQTIQKLQQDVRDQKTELVEMVEGAKTESIEAASVMVQGITGKTQRYLSKCDDRIQALSDLITQIQGGSNMSIQGLSLKLVESQKGTEAAVLEMKASVKDISDSVTTYTSQFDEIVNEIKKQKANAKSLSSSLNDRITTVSDALTDSQNSAISSLRAKIESVVEKLTGKVETLATNSQNLDERLTGRCDTLENAFAQLKLDVSANIEESKNTFRDAVEETLKGMKQSVRQVKDSMKAIKGDTEIDLSTMLTMINDLQQAVDANRDVGVQELKDLFEKVKGRFKSLEMAMNDQDSKLESKIASTSQKNVDYADGVGQKIVQECKAAIKSVTMETRELKQAIADVKGGSSLSIHELESQMKISADDSKLALQKVTHNLRTVADKVTEDIDACQAEIAKLSQNDDDALQQWMSSIESEVKALAQEAESARKSVRKSLNGLQNEVDSVLERQENSEQRINGIESDLSKTIDQYMKASETGHDSIVKTLKTLQQSFDNLETVTVSRINDKLHILTESFNSFQTQSVEAINKVKSDMHTLKRKQKTEIEQCTTNIAAFESNIGSEIELLKRSNSSHVSRLDEHFQEMKDELTESVKQMWTKTRGLRQAMVDEISGTAAKANEALQANQKLYSTILETNHAIQPSPDHSEATNTKIILRQCQELIQQGNDELSERIQKYVLRQKEEINKTITSYSNQTAVMIENLRSELKNSR